MSRNGPAFDGTACAALLVPLVAPEGALALSSLALAFNPLGASGAAAIGTALRDGRLARLESLQLHGCSIGSAGAPALACGLAAGRSLQHLDLSDNDLGDAGVQAVAAELPLTPTLLELLLGRNGLGDTAAHAIATALVKRVGGASGGCRLRLLSLAHNKLRDDAAVALAGALGSGAPHANRSLTSLDLQANKLSDTAVLALGDALVANPRLVQLDLSANRRVAPDGLVAIEKLIGHNRAARKQQPALERVAPNDAAAALADPRVQSLFSGSLFDEARLAQGDHPLGGSPLDSHHPLADCGRNRHRQGGHSSAIAVGGAPQSLHRPTVASGHVSGTLRSGGRPRDESGIDREARQCAEVRAALSGVHEELDAAARECARLRQREATLEAALRREGLLAAPSGGAPWESVTLS